MLRNQTGLSSSNTHSFLFWFYYCFTTLNVWNNMHFGTNNNKKSAIVGCSNREYQRRWQIWEYQNYFKSPVCGSCERQMWSGAISVRVFQEKWGRTSVMHMALVLRRYWFKLEQVQKRKGNLKPIRRDWNTVACLTYKKNPKKPNPTQTNNLKTMTKIILIEWLFLKYKKKKELFKLKENTGKVNSLLPNLGWKIGY